jgi:hypothetical protein
VFCAIAQFFTDLQKNVIGFSSKRKKKNAAGRKAYSAFAVLATII